MTCRAAGQLIFFDQYDVAPAGFREVICDAGACDAATDDDRPRPFHDCAATLLGKRLLLGLGQEEEQKGTDHRGDSAELDRAAEPGGR